MIARITMLIKISTILEIDFFKTFLKLKFLTKITSNNFKNNQYQKIDVFFLFQFKNFHEKIYFLSLQTCCNMRKISKNKLIIKLK